MLGMRLLPTSAFTVSMEFWLHPLNDFFGLFAVWRTPRFCPRNMKSNWCGLTAATSSAAISCFLAPDINIRNEVSYFKSEGYFKLRYLFTVVRDKLQLCRQSGPSLLIESVLNSKHFNIGFGCEHCKQLGDHTFSNISSIPLSWGIKTCILTNTVEINPCNYLSLWEIKVFVDWNSPIFKC